jgi:hypothetical protein
LSFHDKNQAFPDASSLYQVFIRHEYLNLNELSERVNKRQVKLAIAVPEKERVFKCFRVPLLKRCIHHLRTELEKDVVILIMAMRNRPEILIIRAYVINDSLANLLLRNRLKYSSVFLMEVEEAASVVKKGSNICKDE